LPTLLRESSQVAGTPPGDLFVTRKAEENMSEQVYQQDIFGGEAVKVEQNRNGNMMKDFIVPPFSILDAAQSYWQERRKAWISLGIKSEVGRDAEVSGGSPLMRGEMDYKKMGVSGTSIFDPVLCELVYRWFCPPGANILDPFAGGSVRGIVAAKLGHTYKGVDLSAKQIEANLEQAHDIVPDNKPLWFWGDSAFMLDDPKVRGSYDFLFSCPPYFDLEVYGNEQGELSAMTWEEFLTTYYKIIDKAVFQLKQNRFACFVVGEIRDKQGIYRNFVGETVKAFVDAGAKFYNEGILVTSVGSLPVRAGKQFRAGRKLGKRHQNILVFVNGATKAAADACGDINTDSKFWASASDVKVESDNGVEHQTEESCETADTVTHAIPDSPEYQAEPSGVDTAALSEDTSATQEGPELWDDDLIAQTPPPEQFSMF
jgi:hypothetical protein